MPAEDEPNKISVEDAYTLLGLEAGAAESQLKTAYRKLSLKLHPDKRRDVSSEKAAEEFHLLALAFELLSDPEKREAAERKASENAASKARRGAYDGKRKAAADELERREEEDRKRRKAQASTEADLARKLQQAQHESRKLMEEAARKRKADTAQPAAESQNAPARRPEPNHSAGAPPPIGEYDTTVMIKFPFDQLQNLTHCSDPAALSRLQSNSSSLETPLASSLSSMFGPLQSLLIRPPKLRKSGKFSSEMTAVAIFETIDAAFAAVEAGSSFGASGILADCFVSWFPGHSKGPDDKSHEPEKIRWMRAQGQLGQQGGKEASPIAGGVDATTDAVPSTKSSQPPPRFSFQGKFSTPEAVPKPAEYESITLSRLRDAERRRVAAEILQAQHR